MTKYTIPENCKHRGDFELSLKKTFFRILFSNLQARLHASKPASHKINSHTQKPPKMPAHKIIAASYCEKLFAGLLCRKTTAIVKSKWKNLDRRNTNLNLEFQIFRDSVFKKIRILNFSKIGFHVIFSKSKNQKKIFSNF